jgi:hypothetical protein
VGVSALDVVGVSVLYVIGNYGYALYALRVCMCGKCAQTIGCASSVYDTPGLLNIMAAHVVLCAVFLSCCCLSYSVDILPPITCGERGGKHYQLVVLCRA